MKRAIGFYSFAWAALLSIPGCGKIIDWGKSSFYQGQEYKTYRSQVTPYIQSVTLYDQLTTRAHFDVLWLNNETRTTFAELHAMRLAKSPEHQEAFLRRQLEENEHYISFYVLSVYDVKLGVPESKWTVYLEVDDQKYQPIELKRIDLPYEYQIFFGDLYNRFKEAYTLKFSARTLGDQPIVTDATQKITLHVRSASKGYSFKWPVKSGDVIQPEEKPQKEKYVPKRRKKNKNKIEEPHVQEPIAQEEIEQEMIIEEAE